MRKIDDTHEMRAEIKRVTRKIVVRKGRPRIGEEGKTLAALRPWEAEGMSRRTWYRRQAEQRSAGK